MSERASAILHDCIAFAERVLAAPHVAFGEADALDALKGRLVLSRDVPLPGGHIPTAAPTVLLIALGTVVDSARLAPGWGLIASVALDMVRAETLTALETEARL